jgi:hypothetical protein
MVSSYRSVNRAEEVSAINGPCQIARVVTPPRGVTPWKA